MIRRQSLRGYTTLWGRRGKCGGASSTMHQTVQTPYMSAAHAQDIDYAPETVHGSASQRNAPALRRRDSEAPIAPRTRSSPKNTTGAKISHLTHDQPTFMRHQPPCASPKPAQSIANSYHQSGVLRHPAPLPLMKIPLAQTLSKKISAHPATKA